MTSLANNCSYNCSQSEEEEKVAPLCTDLETKVNKPFSFVGTEVCSQKAFSSVIVVRHFLHSCEYG